MTLHYRTIGFAEQHDLGLQPGAGLQVLRVAGRGVQLDVPGGWLSLWMPLSGRLRLESGDGAWEVDAGHLQVWREGRLRCGSPLPCWWLGVAGPVAAWTRPLRAVSAPGDAGMFPWDGRAPRELRRLLVRLARNARRAPTQPAAGPLVEALCAAIVEQQRDLQQRLQRCSGRTLQRRQQTLCRLLRVQHLVRTSLDERLDLARLARSASYSPCHLLRIYRDVFDETPSEYAARLRSDRAWQLVRETAMPVCEITEVLGYESQSAFCRSFKSSFGMTATQLRQRTALDIARAA